LVSNAAISRNKNQSTFVGLLQKVTKSQQLREIVFEIPKLAVKSVRKKGNPVTGPGGPIGRMEV
jgi:hypothetical protein